MRRATTPTHTFTFPSDISVSEVDNALITYSQCGKTVLEKKLDDLEIDIEENMLTLPKMAQNETNLFAPGKALVQAKVQIGDRILESQLIWITVKPALNSGGF